MTFAFELGCFHVKPLKSINLCQQQSVVAAVVVAAAGGGGDATLMRAQRMLGDRMSRCLCNNCNSSGTRLCGSAAVPDVPPTTKDQKY